MNSFVCTGKIAKATEPKEVNGGKTTIVRFSVVSENGQVDKEGNARQDYVSCIVFNPENEFIEFLANSEGTLIEFQGKVTTTNFKNEDKNNYRTEVVVFPKSIKVLGN